MIRAGQALQELLNQLPEVCTAAEKTGLDVALGRYLAEDVSSPEAVPPFDRSAMDGFAVRAADTFGASESSPAYLQVSGRVLMGRAADFKVGSGEAAHIPTGGMLPTGADAVVMVEYTAMLDEYTVEVVKAVAPGEHVVKAGEDIPANQILFKAGRCLNPYDIGALAAAGITEVSVRRRLAVGILSTGDEIVEADKKPEPGQVRDINYYALAGMVRRSGADPLRLGICRDDEDAITESLTAALGKCDLILISGGSSVGVADMTPAVINRLGAPGVLVHGISVKPGKPTILALVGDIPVFGLPGHPVGALDVYTLLVDPVIRYLNSGASDGGAQPRPRVKLGRSLSSVAGREDRVRVKFERVDGELWAQPILGKSGLISLMSRADGVALIPYEAEGAQRGDEVEVELL